MSFGTLLVATGVAGLLVAGLLALGRSTSNVEPPPTTTSATSAPPSTRVATSAPSPVVLDLEPHLLTSIAPTSDGWIGAVFDDGRLVRSNDDGATWMVTTDGTTPTGVVAVGTSAIGQPNALVKRFSNFELLFVTMVLSEGKWVVDERRAPLVVPTDAQIVSAAVGEETIVVIEDQWDRPVAEVSAVVAEFVHPDIADATCRMFRNVVDGASVYDLFDCAGAKIGEINAELRSEAHDRLSFASELLRSRYVVFVSGSEGEPERIEMGPSQVVLSLVPIEGGFAALVLDSLEVLDNPKRLFGGALTVRLVHWDRIADVFTLAETPIIGSVWSANRLVANVDGSITLVTSLGLFSATPPFDDWKLLTTGPFEQLSPGQEFNSALHGDGFFVNDPSGPGLFWASCCGDESNGRESWRDIEITGQSFQRALIATNSILVVHTTEGEIIQIDQ